MTDIDPIHRLTSTYGDGDLQRLVARTAPFLTVLLPSPSEHADAAHRLDVRWRNARRAIEGRWPAELVDQLDRHVDDLPHDGGEAVAIVQASDGALLSEFLAVGIERGWSDVEDLPRLAVVIENRQRTLPHIQVLTDRAGADVVGFDAGAIVDAESVQGDTQHIHRGHPGGWSQRRFQQRAENTWERNADSVAEAVREMASGLLPVLVTVAGEVRARNLVADALVDLPGDPAIVQLEQGDPDGVAAGTLRALGDVHARLQRAALERLRSEPSTTDPREVLDALEAGRVATLLGADRPLGAGDENAEPSGEPRLVDRAIAGALATSASVVIVPATPELEHGVAAVLRW